MKPIAVALCALMLCTESALASSRFWVNNRSNSNITSVVIVYPSGDDGPDLLGKGVIVPSDSVRVLSDPDAPCRVEVMVRTDDGQVADYQLFNACNGNQLNVFDKAYGPIGED